MIEVEVRVMVENEIENDVRGVEVGNEIENSFSSVPSGPSAPSPGRWERERDLPTGAGSSPRRSGLRGRMFRFSRLIQRKGGFKQTL